MTLFMHCSLPAVINPQGWDNWRNPDNEQTARYGEYNNNGEGSNTHSRVSWSTLLTPDQAKQITLLRVMGDDFYPLIIAETHFQP
jgi:pectinesterase